MRVITLAVLLCWAFAAQAQSPTEWKFLGRDSWVSVFAERELYSQAGHKGFFIHVRIYSQTSRKQAVDMRDRLRVFYPNQWGMSAKPERKVIDERRMLPFKPPPEFPDQLLADFRAGLLTPVRQPIDYYVEFTGKRPDQENQPDAQYLIVSMDGRLFFTDGKTVRMLSLEWGRNRSHLTTDLAIALPLEWRRVPAGAITF